MAHPVKSNGRQIGKMVEKDNGETHYVTERKEEDNGFVHKYKGFGINAKILKRMIQDKADLIVVRYHWEDGSQSLYKLTPRQWIHLGTEDKLGNFERQIFASCQLIASQGEQQGRDVYRAKTKRYERENNRAGSGDAAQLTLEGGNNAQV